MSGHELDKPPVYLTKLPPVHIGWRFRLRMRYRRALDSIRRRLALPFLRDLHEEGFLSDYQAELLHLVPEPPERAA